MDSDSGEYGTLSLMRGTTGQVVSVYPLDTPEITFGRDMACSVRLYYPQVSNLHCKIVFEPENRKAYIVVIGPNGISVEGTKVFPSTSSPTIVPLLNNSDIEIHTKRFRFAYPPKDVRAAILAREATGTPAPLKRRAVRMSLIQSAIVFSPRPSPDASENLRVLRSPLKRGAVPVEDPDEPEQEIVLVEGKYPRVVEEDKDLVILEDIDISVQQQQQQKLQHEQQQQQRMVSFSAPPPPQTPRRKPRPSLHRAVLIRSAQRAVQQKMAEELEEEEDEQEVLGFIAGEDEEDEDDNPLNDNYDYNANDNEEEDIEMEDVYEDQEVPLAEEKEDAPPKTTWRRSLEAVTGLFRGSKTPEPEEEDITDAPYHDEDEPEEDEEEEFRYVDSTIQPGGPAQTPDKPKPLGNFMTPQLVHEPFRGAAPRYSVGGGARRVLVDQPWKVKDLVIAEEPAKREEMPETPGRVGRPRLSEEERKAIMERRRSTQTTSGTFFGGQTPGSRRQSNFSGVPMTPMGSLTAARDSSPTKPRDVPAADMDTRSLLEKMKETVEGMKSRRTSNVPAEIAQRARMSMSPTKPSSSTFAVAAPLEEEEETAMDVDHGNSIEEVAAQIRFNSDDEEEEDVVQTPILPRTPIAKPQNPATPAARAIALNPVTPVRTRTPLPPPVETEMEVDEAEPEPVASTSAVVETEPEAPPPVKKAPSATRMRVPRAVTAKAVAEDSPMANDETIPDAAPVRRGRSRTVDTPVVAPAPKAKVVRGKKAVESIPESSEPRASRSRKVKTEDEVMSEATPPVPVAKAVKKTISKLRSKSTVVEEEDEPEEIETPEPAPAPRRGRKPATSASESIPEEVPPPAKTVRKTRIPKATSSMDSEPEVRKGRSATTTPAIAPKKGKGKAAAVVEDEDDDELDMLASAPKPVAKRATRSRTNTAETIKDEEAPVAKATRSSKRNVAASASEDALQGKDKENTPDEEDEPVAPVAKATRAKSSRSATKVKDEPVEVPPMRVTRTRSKK